MLDQIEDELEGRGGSDAVKRFRTLFSVVRWRRQIRQPYTELTEREKESDRKEVRLKLPAYRKALAEERAGDEA